MPRLRPMRLDDVAATDRLSIRAFTDLARRMGEDVPPPPEDRSGSHVRIRHLIATDPGGAWIAEDDAGTPVGAALALRRGPLWGLSLLVVDPDTQSAGIGRALLERSLEQADGARGGIILASPDARALRAYARAGFTMHPTADARGVPRDVAPDPRVRPFEPGDHAMAAEVDRAIRGAPHGDDLDAMAAAGHELLAFPGRGYAARLGGELRLLAAHDEEAAAALLRTVLARVPAGVSATVDWLTGAQAWATEVVVAAGLRLRTDGALFVRGELGAMRPYLPSGPYL